MFRTFSQRRYTVLFTLLFGLLGLGVLARSAQAAETIKVGISVRSMPCTFYPDGQWQGSFYETWQEVAVTANLPYEVITVANFRQLLEMGQTGQVDVALGCINMTPARLAKYRFSVPIQEDGISVLVRKEQVPVWYPILRTLRSTSVLGLLSGLLVFVFIISLIMWRVEGYAKQDATKAAGRPQTFAKLFQILLTGPGTNVIAQSVRGNSLIAMVYFVRIVTTSVLVSLISVNVIKKASEETASAIQTVQDLSGKTVSVGTGSVSEQWVESFNITAGTITNGNSIKIKQIDSLEAAATALLNGQVDAIIADNAQIQYYRLKINPHAPVQVAIRNVHRQSQGLILSPKLSEETALKINQSIARLKENGTIDTIKKHWLPDE